MRYLFLTIILVLVSFIFSACEIDEREGDFPPLGVIWADVENISYTFDDVSGLPSIQNTYSELTKTLSLYRITNAFTSARYGTFRVLLTNFDFDDTTPRVVQPSQVNLTFSPEPNVLYQINGGDIIFEVVSIENDVIRATFSGTLPNTRNPNQRVRVRNGRANIRIIRE